MVDEHTNSIFRKTTNPQTAKNSVSRLFIDYLKAKTDFKSSLSIKITYMNTLLEAVSQNQDKSD